MKRIGIGLVLIGTLIIPFMVSPSSFAQDEGAVEKRVKKLEDENQQLRDLVKQMQERLDKLESADVKKDSKDDGKKKKKDDGKKDSSDKEDKKDDGKKEEKAGDAEDGKKDDKKEDGGKGKEWLPSISGEDFRIGGRLQFEFFNPEQESLLQSARTDHPGGSFHIDELSLFVDADFKNDIRLHSRFDVTGEDEGLVEAYADFDNLYLNSQLRFGLQSRFFRPGRYTETYPLTGIAFWRSRVLGATWKGTYDPFYAYLSVANGPQLDDRQLVEDKSAKMLSDNDIEFDMNGDKEISAGLGLDLDFEQYGKLDLLAFALTGQLSSDDVTYLQTEVPGYGFSFNKDKELAGANLDYGIGEWDFFAQAIGGRDGDMERFSWYTELSYKFEFEGLKYLDSIRPLVRYSELDTNATPQPFMRKGSLTWDREQWLFAVVAELVRNVNFSAEYALNEEDTGGPGVNNNEFLFQLELRF